MSIDGERLDELKLEAQEKPELVIIDEVYRVYGKNVIPEGRDPRADAIIFGLAIVASDEQRGMVREWEYAIERALDLDGEGESWDEIRNILGEEAKLASMGGWEKRSRAISHLVKLI